MKKLLIVVGTVVVLVIVAALVVPFVIPAETYKSELLSRIESATGRSAKIEGDFKFSILPRVQFVAGKVSFANAAGGKAAAMATVDELNVQVGLFPLLSGEVEIDSFILERPVINLEIDRAGKPNWQIGGAAPVRKTDGARSSGGPGISALRLGDVRLVDGQVFYSDARTNVSHRVDAINMSVALPSLNDPLKAEGSFNWNKEKIDLSLALSNPNAYLNGKKTDIEARLAGAPVRLSFKGWASSGAQIKAGGDLGLDIPSVRKLAGWAGAPLQAPGSGYGPLKISGQVDVNGQKYAFRKAELSLDDIKGTGEIEVDGAGRRPLITATLQLDQLDLNPYLPPEAAAPASSGNTSSNPAPARTEATAGWSDDPIDLSGLNSANAELDLSVRGILVRKIKIGQADLAVRLKDGVLVTDLKKIALYEGFGNARFSADGAGRVPRIGLSFDLDKFQASPFLADAMDFKRIEGTAKAKLSVKSEGRTERELVSALDGAGEVKFLDGAIRGINLAAMVRNVSSAFLDPTASKAQKTDFAELSGTYVIRQGVLTNNDLELKSPLLRLSGKGTVSLPKRRVDYRIEPKIVASTKGQGATDPAKGIKVPVIVSGPWENVSYKPDLTGAIDSLAKDPGKVLDAVKGVIPGKSGGGASEPNKSVPDLPIPDAAKKLKGLFGR